MSLSKRDYEDIALVLRRELYRFENEGELKSADGVREVAFALSSVFEAANDRFVGPRFLVAAGAIEALEVGRDR